MRKVRDNILDIENGFNTRVNLYIIRYLYYHMKKDDAFYEKGKGKRRVSVNIKESTGMSRQRFDRIFQGKNFSMDTATVKRLTELFNIDAKYFKKDGELIQIHGIEPEQWKCYFHANYKNSVKNFSRAPKEIMQGEEQVKKFLKRIAKTGYIAEHYDVNSALYRVFYYFEKNKTFADTGAFNKFLEYLGMIKPSDWKELINKPYELEKYRSLLETHYEYVNSYIKCRKLEQI